MAGFYSPATLDQVRAANDIVDVIGSYLPLKRAGANFLALCPFHKEKTPSFNVNPHLQIFHCFGCNKGGDVFTFVREYEAVDFPEAVQRLAARGHVTLESESAGPDQQARFLKEKLFDIHEQITARWQAALANQASGQVARDYLSSRAVPEEMVQLFRLGYAPDSWDDAVNWARGKGFDAATMETAGLILRREGGDGHYDRFRGRLMFPICDEQGRVVGFSGRILKKDEKSAKYVNSPETPIFTKSKVFFGLDKSKRALLDTGHAVVCEGQLDLIACYHAGIQNVVAPQGTAFTAEHARILKRYVPEVVLCFDSDEAGQKAAVRSFDSLLASGLAVRVAVLPAPHDPDSFIKSSGPEAFRQLIQNADGFFDYYLKRLCKVNDPRSDKGLHAILGGMAETTLKTGNQVIIDKYVQKTALQLGVKPEAVAAEFKKWNSARRAAPEETVSDAGSAAPPAAEPPEATELWLMRLLLSFPDLIEWASQHLDPSWIRHSLAREIVLRRLEAFRAATWTTLPAFIGSWTDPQVHALITEAVTTSRTIPNPDQQLRDVALKLRNQALDTRIASAIHRASQPSTTEPERLDLLRSAQELRSQKRQPITPPAP